MKYIILVLLNLFFQSLSSQKLILNKQKIAVENNYRSWNDEPFYLDSKKIYDTLGRIDTVFSFRNTNALRSLTSYEYKDPNVGEVSCKNTWFFKDCCPFEEQVREIVGNEYLEDWKQNGSKWPIHLKEDYSNSETWTYIIWTFNSDYSRIFHSYPKIKLEDTCVSYHFKYKLGLFTKEYKLHSSTFRVDVLSPTDSTMRLSWNYDKEKNAILSYANYEYNMDNKLVKERWFNNRSEIISEKIYSYQQIGDTLLNSSVYKPYPDSVAIIQEEMYLVNNKMVKYNSIHYRRNNSPNHKGSNFIIQKFTYDENGNLIEKFLNENDYLIIKDKFQYEYRF